MATLPKLRKLEGLTLQAKITLTREMRLRLLLAMWLIRLAGWILGCRIEVEKNIDSSPDAPAA